MRSFSRMEQLEGMQVKSRASYFTDPYGPVSNQPAKRKQNDLQERGKPHRQILHEDDEPIAFD